MASAASAVGARNRAAAPVPSDQPVTPGLPATVDTAPAWVTRRIVALPASATNTSPAGVTATALGYANDAPAPLPSALPDAPGVPAIVVTVPADEIFRITWFHASAT